MNATISLETILQMLSPLSNSNKRWLAEHLIEQATFTREEVEAAKKRGETMRQFIEKFRTDEISEEDIWAECEAVRQEMYEERQQAR